MTTDKIKLRCTVENVYEFLNSYNRQKDVKKITHFFFKKMHRFVHKTNN